MKKLKKVILSILCIGVIFGTAACGADNTQKDNAANNTNSATADQQDRADESVTGDRNETDNAAKDNKNDEGAVEHIGDAVKDGVKDMTDSVPEEKR